MAEPKKKVALVALGPSNLQFIQTAEGCGDMKRAFDEVWSVNTFGSVIRSDLVFHMDDVRIQMRRASVNEKIAGLVEWLKRYDGRVITSRSHPDFPCLEEYPLEDVLNEFKVPYFNGTLPYAVAYALWRGDVSSLMIYGADYNWRGASEVEPGRACLEYWIGRAMERGVEVGISRSSTLMDTSCRSLYGYDTLKVAYTITSEGSIKVIMVPKDDFPSGEDMERLYDHSMKESINVKG